MSASTSTTRGRRPAAALAGVLGAATALGVAELLAVLVREQASPVIAVGGLFVDNVPAPLKDFAIRTFGENDKIVLVAGIVVTIVVLAAVVGLLALRRRAVGIAGVALLGIIAAVAAVTRPGSGWLDALPSLGGGLAGVVALLLLLRPLTIEQDASADETITQDPDLVPAGARGDSREGGAHALSRRPGNGMLHDTHARTDRKGSGFDRRTFLATSAITAAVAAAAGAAGRALLERRFDVSASRADVVIPTPDSPAPPLPQVEVGVDGVADFFTPNDDFYRVDTALIVPQVSTEEWTLRVHGMVDREITLTFDQLLARPTIERVITLACVSNQVGGQLSGNARWIGVPLKDLLEEAGVQEGANQVVSTSADGMTIGTPTESLMDGRDAILAFAMNGEPLPAEHGFPVRMVVPNLYGYVSATKWVVDLELTTFEATDTYWVERGWDEQAPRKIFSRVDTPTVRSRPTAGLVPVAGIAYAAEEGIAKVEVRIDEGEWQEARLAESASVDYWRQWVLEWEADPGPHRISVRATDGAGRVQPEERLPPFPNGATGWHNVLVTVA